MAHNAAVHKHRQRLKERGLVQLEVLTPEADAEVAISRKELLASAPLEGIDLERPRDLGRDVDL